MVLMISFDKDNQERHLQNVKRYLIQYWRNMETLAVINLVVVLLGWFLLE